MPIKFTKDDITELGGAFVLEREISNDVNGVARKMRTAARLSAKAAEESLRKDLEKHRRSDELYDSIESVVTKEGPNIYSASTSVGLGVEHSIYFFKDTRKGVENLFAGAASDKLYGPTNDGRGPQYLQSFKGYKGHEEYITRAQRKANAFIRKEIRSINRST